MENTPLLLAVLACTLVSLITVLLYLYFRDQQRPGRENRQKAFTTVLPLQLAAYERILLLLTRMDLESMVARADPNGKTAGEYADQLMSELRMEYEHNAVQQLYLYPPAWEALEVAKEQTLKLVQASVQKLGPTATAAELAEGLKRMAPQQAAAGLKAARALLATQLMALVGA